MKINPLILPLLLSLSLFTAGCGSDEELNAYYTEMETFISEANAGFAALHELDPAAETAVEDMLNTLDGLSVSFQSLADISVPEQFAANETLADDAADYMAEAARLYREAYAGEEYDSYAADAAQENYSRAIRRVEYISQILQGEIPSDDSITVITETENSGFLGDQ